MIANGIRIGGALTYWSLAEHTDRDYLARLWEREGFKDFVPEPRAPITAMKDALEDVLGGPTMLVRPLAKRDGWAVVQEERGKDDNRYSTIVTATVDDKTLAATVLPYSKAVPVIEEKYRYFLGTLKLGQVAAGLVRILASLGATNLRPKGGLYAVPDTRLDEWERLAHATEQASPGSKVYLLRHIMDEGAVRAIRDAITNEVLAEAKRINDEIDNGELGKRGLETRKEQAKELRRKVLLYEELLNASLDHLTLAAQDAEGAAGRAALLVAAGVGGD